MTTTDQFHQIEQQIDAFIKEMTSKYNAIKNIYERRDRTLIKWDVEKLSFKASYVTQPRINKRATKKNLEEIKEYFDLLKEKGELYFYLVKVEKNCKTLSGVCLNKIDDDLYSFDEKLLSPALEAAQKRYDELYAPREGCIPCDYCRKQVPIDKVVKHKLIYRGRNQYGKAVVLERIGNYCSGECAFNDQCAHEG